MQAKLRRSLHHSSPGLVVRLLGESAICRHYSILFFNLLIICINSSLKTGGAEISREKWDEAGAARGEDDEMVVLTAEESEAILRDIIPDWTHIPLSPGAPHAPRQASVGA
jgi:hypothetical protein